MPNAVSEIFKAIMSYLSNHLLELFNPQTPSYKTSATAAVLFAFIILLSGEKLAIFWLGVICCGFFSLLAIKQYGFGNLLKRS